MPNVNLVRKPSTDTSTGEASFRDTFSAGVVFPFAGSVAPDGWLLCDGSAINRVTYSRLFAMIGTTYGVGDGSTTFNLPDIRGRIAIGKDDMGGFAANRITVGGSGIAGNILGATGGTETHVLTNSQMPIHNHGGATGGHTHDVGTGSVGGNNAVAGNYTRSSSVQTAALSATASISNDGGGGAHNNTQPSMILNYIIKT